MKDVYLLNLRDAMQEYSQDIRALIEHLEGGGERGPIMDRKLRAARQAFDAIMLELY